MKGSNTFRWAIAIGVVVAAAAFWFWHSRSESPTAAPERSGWNCTPKKLSS
ncbi:hypothetical protein, partial [Salmonella enterica]|uniref:hypothetical protein n=1 Tax=Salmonella enterica TaxID=28901 RepID=UPI002A75710C